MSKVTATLTRPVPVTPPATVKIELELNEREAEALLVLTAFIGGPSQSSARGITEALGAALREAGVRSLPTKRDDPGSPLETHSTAIYFRPYSEYTDK